MADDQGKGKIVPRKGLFVQEHDFLSSIPSWDTFFHSAGGFQPPVQKSVNRSIYRPPYGCLQFVGLPISQIMDAPSFQEFP